MFDTMDLVFAAIAVGFVAWGGYLSLVATDRRKADVRSIAHHRRRTDGLPNLRTVDSSSAGITRAFDFSIGFRTVENGEIKRAA